MGQRPTSQEIDAQAAAWVVRCDRSALSAAEQARLDAWLEADSRASGALLRAQAVSLQTEAAKALGPDFLGTSGPAAPTGPTRRQWIQWSGAAAAGVAIAGLVLPPLLTTEAHATERGEVKLVPLEGGSSVTLNTDSRLAIRKRGDVRLVELTRGEAYFHIAAAQSPRTDIKLGSHVLRAATGSFAVRRLADDRSEITIQRGDLRLEATARDSVPLPQGARIEVGGTRPTVQPMKLHDIDRALMWREGKLAFEGETLAEAARSFARYGGPSILIEDAALAAEPVTGLFASNDPRGFSQAVALALGARVEARPEGLMILR